MEDAKVQSHFEDQLTSLMRQYGNELLRMCCVLLRDRALAEDAVQETFLKAYRGLPKFRGDCSEKTWLICIAVNSCKTMMRRPWFKITGNNEIAAQTARSHSFVLLSWPDGKRNR